jgi:hypothetical protein
VREDARRSARLGGFRTGRRAQRGIDPDELPALNSPEAAQQWAEIIGRAVASGRLAASAGNTVRCLLSEYLSATEVRAMQERLAQLGAHVGRLTPARGRR